MNKSHHIPFSILFERYDTAKKRPMTDVIYKEDSYEN